MYSQCLNSFAGYPSGARRRLLRCAILVWVTVAACLIPAAAAHALAAYQEPTFTKGTTNTWWWSYSNEGPGYGVCLTLYINGQSQGFHDDGCVQLSASGGTISKTHSGLVSGSTYEECADSTIDGIGNGEVQCSTTTMDDSIPAASTGVDGTANYTNDPVMHLQIFYADSLSEPWPGGSTFDCWRKNSDTVATGCQNAPGGADQFQFDQGCSSPSAFDTSDYRSSSWTCDYNISSFPGFSDGTWYYCVREADEALPDNPSGPNQFIATSDQANLSPDTPSSCGSITLDRTPPAVGVQASTTHPVAGQLVNFGATSSDATSGTTGTYDWDFGDNTAHGSGVAPTHTYTSPGTYHVTVTTQDRAGNVGSASATLTVDSSGGSGGSGSGSGGSGSGGSGSGGSGSGSGGSGSGGSGSGGSGSGSGGSGSGGSGSGGSGSGGSGSGGSGSGGSGSGSGGQGSGGGGSTHPTSACRVPKLTGKSETAARALLRQDGCQIGKLTVARAPKHHPAHGYKWALVVLVQSQKPGSDRPLHTKVALRLGYKQVKR